MKLQAVLATATIFWATLISATAPGYAQTALSCPAVASGEFIAATHNSCGKTFPSDAAFIVSNEEPGKTIVALSFAGVAAQQGDEHWIECNGAGCSQDGIRTHYLVCRAPSGAGACNITFVTPAYDSGSDYPFPINGILRGSFSIANNATTIPGFNISVSPGPPQIRGVNPTEGSELGGTAITLHGNNFTGATSVKFGGAPATGLTVVSDNELTIISPPGSPGITTISVETPNGGREFSGFRYLDATSPILAEVTPVPTPSGNRTPSYTFSSSEAGRIFYEGACSSNTKTAVAGDNTVSFKVLPAGTYADCQISVVDFSGNVSENLTVSAFTVLESAASLTTTSGDGQKTTVLSGFSDELIATVTDASGGPVQAVTVNFTTSDVGASAVLSSASAVTDAKGRVSISARANGKIGSHRVTASVVGLPPVHFALVNQIGPPARFIATSGSRQYAPLNTEFKEELVATVKDVAGNPIPNVEIGFSRYNFGATADLSSNSVLTNSDGRAAVRATANGIAGRYTISARTIIGLTPTAVLFHMVNTAGDSFLIVRGSRQYTTVNSAFPGQLVARLINTYGEPIPNVTVTFSTATDGASAALSASSIKTDARGEVAVTATANRFAGRYRVVARTHGMPPLEFRMSNIPDQAKQIEVVSGSPQSASINSRFRPLRVRVSDASGNPVGTHLVELSLPDPTVGPGAHIVRDHRYTDLDGIASFTLMANSRTGSYRVTASSKGTNDVEFNLTNTAGAPKTIVATSGTPQTIAIEQPFEGPLTVRVVDANGNPVPGQAISFTAPSVGPSASLSAQNVTSDANGEASVKATANSQAGSYQVAASTPGLEPVQFALTNTVGAPDKIVAISGTPQSVEIGKAFEMPLAIKVTDAGGNPLSGLAISFAAPETGPTASLSTRNLTTNAQGEAAVEAVASSEPGSYMVTASAPGLEPAEFALTNNRDSKADVRETQRVIRNFMTGRADQLVSSDPDLVSRLRGGGPNTGAIPFGFTGSGAEGGTTVGFSVSLRGAVAAQNAARAKRRAASTTDNLDGSLNYDASRTKGAESEMLGFDIWAEGKWAHVDTGETTSDISFFYAGVDYRFSSKFLLGVLAQFDWIDQKDVAAAKAVEGYGWMVGPYAVWKLHQNVVVDGRAAWGRSANSVNALGLGYDDFDTERWLVRGSVTGDFRNGNWHFAPAAGIVYFEEEQHDYRDRLGNFIPSQTITLGRLSFGPKITYTYKAPDGSELAPFVSVKGLWDFKSTPALAASGPSTETTPDLRARVEGGLSLSRDGLTISGEAFYDGIGADDFEAYGGRIGVRLSFN